jgi:uncharacterized RDD family membrane protein YckC
LTDEGSAQLEAVATRVLAQRHVRRDEREAIRREIMSHLYSAAEGAARARNAQEVDARDIDAALARAGGEQALVAAFVEPVARPLPGASMLPRAGAYLVDVVSITLVALSVWALALGTVAALIFSLGHVAASSPADIVTHTLTAVTERTWAFLVMLAAAFATVSLPFVYFAGLEAWRGQTIGHRLFGLRVVQENGARPTPRQSLARSVTKSLALPIVPGGIGLLVIDALWFVERDMNRRLTDRLAGTVVTKEETSA